MVKYETIQTLHLDSKDTIIKSHHMPELVHLDDPAFSVMIDFSQAPALTLNEDTCLSDAHNEMEFHGTHLMFVIDEEHHITGVLRIYWVKNPLKSSKNCVQLVIKFQYVY